MNLKGLVIVPGLAAGDLAAIGAQMTPIANRPLTCHVIDALTAAGARSVALVAPPAVSSAVRGSLSHGLATPPDEIVQLTFDGDGDLGGALIAAAAFVGEDACVAHPANGLLCQELAPFVEALRAGGPDLLVLLHSATERPAPLEPRLRRLLRLDEIASSRGALALTGVCLFGPGALARSARQLSLAGGRADLAALAALCAGEQGIVDAAVVGGWSRYSGAPRDLLELNRMVLEAMPARPLAAELDDSRVEGRVDIHPTALVRSSIVVGPSIIGPGALISHSYIGPYTAVGANAEIENSEVTRSIVCDGARIANVGGRIEASTIGRNARIFRDFALPRAIRMHVGESVELALA
jgi:glucose-1-phosphate thymidylyltransferase